MGRIDRGDFGAMSEGTEVRARRERLGMTLQDLAKEAGVSRDTLSDLESGTKDFRQLTLAKIKGALDRIEEEAGVHAPPPAEPAPGEGQVTFRLSGNFGVDVTVQGPVSNLPELEASVEKLLRGMKAQSSLEADDEG